MLRLLIDTLSAAAPILPNTSTPSSLQAASILFNNNPLNKNRVADDTQETKQATQGSSLLVAGGSAPGHRPKPKIAA
jgi:hypothetical protein